VQTRRVIVMFGDLAAKLGQRQLFVLHLLKCLRVHHLLILHVLLIQAATMIESVVLVYCLAARA
jgi:hypothetical protein